MNAATDPACLSRGAVTPSFTDTPTMSALLPLSLRISARRDLSAHIVALELEALDGMPLPAYEAGAHLAIDCRAATAAASTSASSAAGLADDNARPELARLRHYSLCGDPADPMHYVIAIRREDSGRGGSRFLCDTAKPGDVLQASEPINLFAIQWPEADATPAPTQLLIAGGVGITPLIAMAWAMDNAGVPFALHEFGRAAAAHVSDALAGSARWRSAVQRHIGRSPDLAALIGAPEPGRHLYVCGPATMSDAVFETARALGWPAHHLHTERFAAPDARAPRHGGTGDVGDTGDVDVGGTIRDAAKTDPDGPFIVELARSGRQVSVAAGESACAALSRAGVYIPMSCEQGVCGACKTSVLSGTPDHRDWILTAEEQAAGTVFTPCCSRSRTPILVLDL
ncbi:PDR/VanB family oxidoreductase [Robbsia sp. KACC 23696]|uniref:PDR/VanB family oxidoreductase n=1 Tax=Robbsia sp. KACC 23696 TaxID=3149231 RepID=UPI00325A87AE